MCSINSKKNMSVGEKLYLDSHFRLLQYKNNDEVQNSLSIIRELIGQSNHHFTEQNTTELGAEKYKSELFTEYFNIVDNDVQEGLLPVVDDPVIDKTSFSQLNIVPSLQKFKSYLSNFVNTCNTDVSKFNPVKPASSKHVSNIFCNTAKEQTKPDFDKHGMHNGFSKRIPKKSKFEEALQDKSYSNKKVRVQSKFQSKESSNNIEIGFVSASTMYKNPLKQSSDANPSKSKSNSEENQDTEPRNNEVFKHFDKKIVDVVLNEIMDFSPDVKWSDIAGLEFVKTTVQEIVIWPLLRPDIFTGLRAPPRGILLFGPPGTGKTLIGKCIATESNSTFFCISASSLASKWVGESEQMVRVLFAAARLNQPSVIFIDEIDSLLSQRSDKDQDFTRKLKTEFLVQFDGAKTNTEERVLVVGATNRPHELDEAARRRFVKRLFVPLPDESARRQIIQKLLNAHQNRLSTEDFQIICDDTKGYSGSDVAHLCKEAAMGPIRCIGPENIKSVSLDQVRPIALCDFTDALRQVRASVVADDLNYYMEWNKKFGSFGIPS